MRKQIVSHFLNAITNAFKNEVNSGLVAFVLTTPSSEKLKEAREHLRYWPYVKAFYPKSDTQMYVLFYVGDMKSKVLYGYYRFRAQQLLNQCLRQYHAEFSESKICKSLFYCYHPNGFLRPDDLLKPFSVFINELDKPFINN